MRLPIPLGGVLVGLIGLLACGGADVDSFVSACSDSSNIPEEICACAGERAAKELSPEGFDFLVASIRGDKDEATRLREQLDAEVVLAASTFMLSAPADCAAELAQSQ